MADCAARCLWQNVEWRGLLSSPLLARIPVNQVESFTEVAACKKAPMSYYRGILFTQIMSFCDEYMSVWHVSGTKEVGDRDLFPEMIKRLRGPFPTAHPPSCRWTKELCPHRLFAHVLHPLFLSSSHERSPCQPQVCGGRRGSPSMCKPLALVQQASRAGWRL